MMQQSQPYIYVADCFLVPNSYERYHFNVETLSRQFGFRLMPDGELCADSWYLLKYRDHAFVLAAAREHLKHYKRSAWVLVPFCDPFTTAQPCWMRAGGEVSR